MALAKHTKPVKTRQSGENGEAKQPAVILFSYETREYAAADHHNILHSLKLSHTHTRLTND